MSASNTMSRFTTKASMKTSNTLTAGGVRVAPVLNKPLSLLSLSISSSSPSPNFWMTDPLMAALKSSLKWGDLIPVSLSPTIDLPGIDLNCDIEDLRFYARMSNPFDDAWDTTRLTEGERIQFYAWAAHNGWVMSDITPEGLYAALPSVYEWASLAPEEPTIIEEYRPSPEDIELAEKKRRKEENIARQVEITERKAALAAEGKPVNRAERRAAEKAAKEAAAAAAVAVASAV